MAMQHRTSQEERKVCFLSAELIPRVSLPDSIPRHPVDDFRRIQPENDHLNFFCVTDSWLREHAGELFDWAMRISLQNTRVMVLSSYDYPLERYSPLTPDMIYLTLPENISSESLSRSIRSGLDHLAALQDRTRLLTSLGHSYQEIQRLTAVGQALASERDFDTLIGSILSEARELVHAHAGSIYVTDRREHGVKPTHLIFKKSALNLDGEEFLLPINKRSIAGYVALTGEPLVIDDVYRLTGEEEYRFNSEYDHQNNYYSRSMLVIPMKNHEDAVIGVIQLINRKRSGFKELTVEDMQGDGVTPFSSRDLELGMALAGQAAVAIENNQLLQDISNLFEGFVRASVSAIEQRDPTTSGHSFRVAELSTGMAIAADRATDRVFVDIKFTPQQIRELRYASLLHDFGKVGVREHVLVKAKKLYPSEIEVIRWRFRFIRKSFEARYLKRRVDFLEKYGKSSVYHQFLEENNRELEQHLTRLDRMLEIIEVSNEPTVLSRDAREELEHIARCQFRMDGELHPFLRSEELLSLQVKKGNLNDRERQQIMLHVTNTYNFLIQIPWTGDLINLPEIALGHHEKLDGSGYPFGMEGGDISLQTRMMTIADIYDALTAADRPYKKGMSSERALDILQSEARQGLLDSGVLDLFIQAGVYKLI